MTARTAELTVAAPAGPRERDGDRGAVTRFLERQWGSAVQVAHGTVFRPAELPGLIAQAPGEPMAGLRPGAVTRARRAKPEIPMTGEHSIPLRDELDLIRSVRLCDRMSGRDSPGWR